MKITQADAPTIRIIDCHPTQTNWCPHLCHPTIFMSDALPGTTIPIYPGLGQAPSMLACIPSGLATERVTGLQNLYYLSPKAFLPEEVEEKVKQMEEKMELANTDSPGTQS